MKRHLFMLVAELLLCSISYAKTSPRLFISLDKEWGYKPITSAVRKAPLIPVTIPHTWNAEYLPGQISYNREMMVYKRTLTISPEMEGKRLFLFRRYKFCCRCFYQLPDSRPSFRRLYCILR